MHTPEKRGREEKRTSTTFGGKKMGCDQGYKIKFKDRSSTGSIRLLAGY